MELVKVNPVTLVSGSATSSEVAFSAGPYSWTAVYNGDANNNAATSSCEPLTVNKASPTVGTTLTTNPITAGQTDTDMASVTGGASPTGTMTFYTYTIPDCSRNWSGWRSCDSGKRISHFIRGGIQRRAILLDCGVQRRCEQQRRNQLMRASNSQQSNTNCRDHTHD